MTEHSKIPLPEDEDGKAKPATLLERAEAMFGLGDFAPAPMPEKLAKAPAKRGARKKPAAKPAPEAIEPAVEAPKPAVQPAPEPAPVAEPAPAPEPVAKPAELEKAPEPVLEPVTFSAKRHKIDRAHLRKNGLILPEGPVTALLEEFRIVKRQVLLASKEARKAGRAGAQRVLVCSPLPNEGKTFTSANLALAMAAEKDSEVILVDADFAKPSIVSTFGLKEGPGLMDVLSDKSLRVEDCVQGTDVPGLFILPAGNRTNSDSEFLSSDRTAEVLDRLTQGAPRRIVIFDSPPALAASPAAELAKYVAQALVVVRADETGQSSLEDAIALLGSDVSGGPDIKLVLNAANFSPSGRRFGSYYGYGE
ncbi:AAA family ATPase [Paraurantiacibacter namhicola]|uniref:Tyrosine-protein kinase ptk n=1 Tax=Paraurantiacibacter namhicola TaxID=645517 RepID=A0A1C7D9L4_9SPHN|nr:AAA family ATPase [Paraurantiacibacter namhicola]ANU08138.1 Tyrosine-protein kinase ptk [Paraurantiacibacter namhicola]